MEFYQNHESGYIRLMGLSAGIATFQILYGSHLSIGRIAYRIVQGEVWGCDSGAEGCS